MKSDKLVLNRQFKPKSRNQAEYIRAIAENEIVISIGPAGTGKTAVAVGTAINYLADGKVSKLVFTRPTVGTSVVGDKGIGFIPGDIRAKMDPYLRPIFDELATYLTKSAVEELIRNDVIEISPLHYMRGRTFHDSFVIADEAQNMTYEEIEMMMTRIGSRSKMVLTGDIEQHDLPKYLGCQLTIWAYDVIGLDDPDIPVCVMDESDIVRSDIVRKVLEKVKRYEKNLKK